MDTSERRFLRQLSIGQHEGENIHLHFYVREEDVIFVLQRVRLDMCMKQGFPHKRREVIILFSSG